MKINSLIALVIICNSFLFSQHLQTKDEIKPDWEENFPDGCTTIAVGKLASFDGSVMTSHTDDSHRTRSEFDVVPAKTHKPGTMKTLYKRLLKNNDIYPREIKN